VGQQALRVIEALGPEYEVVGLSGHSRVELLAEQVRRCRARYVAVTDPGRVGRFRQLIEGVDVEVLCGPEGLVELASRAEVDIVLTAVVGAAGLEAVLAAARCGKQLAIANKEPLVAAGQLLMEQARASGALVVPVDSEHSAVFQAVQAGRAEEIRRIILTASGGPFRGMRAEQIENASPQQVLAHPVWQMGPKITVDSATMMNKALEIIEARWLFDVEVGRIEVLIHPESIVHSLVEFVDGSVIAQLGEPDMAVPIQYALTYPRRVAGIARQLRLEQVGVLRFERPDERTFRALPLAYEVARRGGTAAAVFSAANEAAVEQFLAGRIRFGQIVELVEHCLQQHREQEQLTLEAVLAADAWARREVAALVCGAAG